EPARERLVDAHGFLLGPARQPDLGPHDPFAVLQQALDEHGLRPVGGGDVEVGMLVGEGGDGLAFPAGDEELVGHGPGLDHRALPWSPKRTVTAPRWANSARKTSPGSTGTMRCTAPGRTTSPARSPAPKMASLLASQATH